MSKHGNVNKVSCLFKFQLFFYRFDREDISAKCAIPGCKFTNNDSHDLILKVVSLARGDTIIESQSRAVSTISVFAFCV